MGKNSGTTAQVQELILSLKVQGPKGILGGLFVEITPVQISTLFVALANYAALVITKNIQKVCTKPFDPFSVHIFFSQCIKLKGFFMPRSYKTINKSEIVKLSELETGLNSAGLS